MKRLVFVFRWCHQPRLSSAPPFPQNLMFRYYKVRYCSVYPTGSVLFILPRARRMKVMDISMSGEHCLLCNQLE